MNGTENRRPSRAKPHSSTVHWLSEWNSAAVASPLAPSRSSMADASVGKTSEACTPCSSRSAIRPSPVRHVSGGRIGLPESSRSVRPSGFSARYHFTCEPGAATTANVGFGMNSESMPAMTSLRRPSTSTK